MGGPDWLSYSFAALMLLTAAYCVGRLVYARRFHRVTETDVELVHIAMGVVMAGMLVAALQFVPNGLAEVIFAFATLWFAWRAVDRLPMSPAADGPAGTMPCPHVVLSGAMFYMVAAQPSSPMAAMTSMSQSVGQTVQFAPLGAILALVLFGYAIWYANQLAPAGRSRSLRARRNARNRHDEPDQLRGHQLRRAPSNPEGSRPRPKHPPDQASDPYLEPRLGMCCHIAMCVTMGYMLIAML